MAETYDPYDPESAKLAEYFLEDEPQMQTDPEAYRRAVRSLAIEIQRAVEGWFDSHDAPPPLENA